MLGAFVIVALLAFLTGYVAALFAVRAHVESFIIDYEKGLQSLHRQAKLDATTTVPATRDIERNN